MGFLTIVPVRMIGPFTAQVTIEERHRDEIAITRHPVEQGAQISDHAYRLPAAVTITGGWSNSAPANLGGGGGIIQSAIRSVTSILGTGGNENFVREMYEKLLKLQASLVPFAILTGKRNYSNMLLRELETDTTAETGTTFLFRAHCVEILITQTQSVKISPNSVQADPSKTGSVSNAGTQQLQPVPGG